jgi:hypothetical protein
MTRFLFRFRWYRTILRRELTEYLVAQVGNNPRQISKNIDKYFENKKIIKINKI